MALDGIVSTGLQGIIKRMPKLQLSGLDIAHDIIPKGISSLRISQHRSPRPRNPRGQFPCCCSRGALPRPFILKWWFIKIQCNYVVISSVTKVSNVSILLLHKLPTAPAPCSLLVLTRYARFGQLRCDLSLSHDPAWKQYDSWGF